MSKENKSDIILVEAALKGDDLSFAALVRKYNAQLLFNIYKMVNNIADAEDISVEVFEKVHKNLSSYSPEFAFSTWLFTIARNHTIDFLRNKQQQPHPINNPFSTEEDFMTPSLSLELSGEDIMIKEETSIIVNKVIETLNPFHRKLIEMKYYKGLSYEEISKQLNKPIGTIKTGLFRAKKALYKLLKENKNIR